MYDWRRNGYAQRLGVASEGVPGTSDGARGVFGVRREVSFTVIVQRSPDGDTGAALERIGTVPVVAFPSVELRVEFGGFCACLLDAHFGEVAEHFESGMTGHFAEPIERAMSRRLEPETQAFDVRVAEVQSFCGVWAKFFDPAFAEVEPCFFHRIYLGFTPV